LCTKELSMVKIADFGIAMRNESMQRNDSDVMTMTSNLGTPGLLCFLPPVLPPSCASYPPTALTYPTPTLLPSVAYMAPELCQDSSRTGSKIFSSKLDVYSFGLCCWALYHNAKPYDDAKFTNIFTMMNDIVGGLRPTISIGVPRWVVSLLERCWSADPEHRPSFEEIVCIFEAEVLSLEKMEPEAEPVAAPQQPTNAHSGFAGQGMVLQTRAVSSAVLVV
jgi:serine/threonine protein kinase